jgi:hypothetical protein
MQYRHYHSSLVGIPYQVTAPPFFSCSWGRRVSRKYFSRQYCLRRRELSGKIFLPCGGCLDLGNTAYFWAKDAASNNELFLSDNSKKFKVFYVKSLGINSVNTSHTGNALPIMSTVAIADVRQVDNPKLAILPGE